MQRCRIFVWRYVVRISFMLKCAVCTGECRNSGMKYSKRLPNSYFVTFIPQTTLWYVVCLYNVKPCPHLRIEPRRNGVAFTSAWDVGVDATECLRANWLCALVSHSCSHLTRDAVRSHLPPRRNVTSSDVGWKCDGVVFRPQREPNQSECQHYGRTRRRVGQAWESNVPLMVIFPSQ